MAKKLSQTDLQNLPACAAEYIKLVIKKMRYRKKVRADVMAELAAHFEDELRDCKTDEEKQQKAQQIIETFGDVKLLGVLLRRAKKRCRPLWRTVVARTFQATGVLILCFILYVAWFLSGKPVVTVDYVAELNRIVRPVADETLNAAPLYHKAAELHAELHEELPDDISELLRKKYEEVTSEEKLLIEKWIADNKEVLELLIAGSKKPYYWRTYSNKQNTSEMIYVLLPHLTDFKNLSRALRWRAWLRAGDGRYEEAFDDIKSCYRFGQHVKGGMFLIEQLVGIGIEGLATETIRRIITKHKIDSTALVTLQTDFEQMIAGEDFKVSFESEILSIYDEIQRSFTEGLGGGHIIPKRISELSDLTQLVVGLSGSDFTASSPKKQGPGWLSEFISDIQYMGRLTGSFVKYSGYVLFLHPDKQQTRQTAECYWAFWGEMAHKTPAQIRAENINFNKKSMEMVKGNILLQILSPVLDRACEYGYKNKAEVKATITILALLRYRQDKSTYPDDLDDLTKAGYLTKLPMDPYSDKPVVYKRIDDDFILYSIGRNFRDDGGQVVWADKGRVKKWADEGDVVFWPVQK